MTYMFRYDRESGAFYIRVREGEYSETMDLVDPGFGAYVDLDVVGNVLGFEFLSFEEFTSFIEGKGGRVEIPDRLPENSTSQPQKGVRPELRKVQEAFESLDPQLQKVLRLRIMEGFSLAKTAEELDVSIVVAYRELQAGLQEMRKSLGSSQDDIEEDNSLEEALALIA